MELFLQSFIFTAKSTISTLKVNDTFECYILEDTIREIPGLPVAQWKIPKQTAIPAGRYQVILSRSTRFKKVLPEVLEVEGFRGIRIHGGNKPEDTEGCLLTGITYGEDCIFNSQKAFVALMEKLANAEFEGEKIWLTVSRRHYYDKLAGSGSQGEKA